MVKKKKIDCPKCKKICCYAGGKYNVKNCVRPAAKKDAPTAEFINVDDLRQECDRLKKQLDR